MWLCKKQWLLALIVTGVAISFPVSAQETAYAFNTKCFTWHNEGMSIQMSLRSDAARECYDTTGIVLSAKAVSIVYSQDATDERLIALKKEVDDIAAKAVAAIKESVAENSVKAGDIDAAVKIIEQKLYENVLRRVKADLPAQPNRSAGPHQ